MLAPSWRTSFLPAPKVLALPESILILPSGTSKKGRPVISDRTSFWRSIRDLNSGGAVNALSHFEFCVPNVVCAPPGSKQAVSSRPFWPHHADFQRIRPQNRVGTSKSILPPFGAKSNAFREKCKIPCKITGRAFGPPGRVLAGLPQRRISPQARKSPRNSRILSYRYGFSGSEFHQRRIRP